MPVVLGTSLGQSVWALKLPKALSSSLVILAVRRSVLFWGRCLHRLSTATYLSWNLPMAHGSIPIVRLRNSGWHRLLLAAWLRVAMSSFPVLGWEEARRFFYFCRQPRSKVRYRTFLFMLMAW